MKKLLLCVLLFLNFNIYALANSSQSSRTYTPTFRHWYKPFYNSANFRERVAYNIYKGMDVSNNNGPKYASTSTASSQFRGSTGATSSGTVSGTVTKTIPKQTVFQKVFQNGKNAAVAARKLGTRALPYAGWALTAYDLYTLLGRQKGYNIECEEGLCMRLTDDQLYQVYFSDQKVNLKSHLPALQRLAEACAGKSCTFYGYSSLNEKRVEPLFNEVCRSQGGTGGLYSDQSCIATPKPVYPFIIVMEDNLKPFTEQDFMSVAEEAADKAIEKFVQAAGPNLQWSEPKIHILAGQVAQSNPYTNPTTNQPEQAKWTFSNDAQGNTIVEETIIPRPDLKPNSPEAPKAETPTTTNTPTNNDPKRQPTQTQDLCEKNPDILACDTQPEAPTASVPLAIPTETVNLNFQPETVFPNADQCPAPVSFQVFSQTYQISTQPICDAAEKMRPFIIALAFVAAAFFVIAVVKSES